MDDSLRERVLEQVRCAGFDDAGVAPCTLEADQARDLDRWLDAGYAGQMGWLERNREVRRDLRRRFPWARSVVVARRDYRPSRRTDERGLLPYLSSYAWGEDYHEVLGERLQKAAQALTDELGALRWHAYVDTGPVMERQLAETAGLGWRGKNGLLLHGERGSRFFLAVLLTDLELEPTSASGPGCGSCVACQVNCPTDAFVEPGVLDARRCISYLTIEHRGRIDRALRPAMGQWLFGCDLCQTCCPFEHHAAGEGDEAFAPAAPASELSLAELLDLDEAEFRTRWRGTPLARPKREGLLRNALIVAANGEHRECLPAARALLRDDSAVLREAASWCLARLEDHAALEALEVALAHETVSFAREGMREDLEYLRRCGAKGRRVDDPQARD